VTVIFRDPAKRFGHRQAISFEKLQKISGIKQQHTSYRLLRIIAITGLKDAIKVMLFKTFGARAIN